MKILVINGPNLEMLGKREPEVYGDITYDQMVVVIIDHAKKRSVDLNIFQSNYEGEIIDKINTSYNKIDAIIINPGGFTHYSIAIRDSLLSISVPFIEVHISNIYKREDFRKRSVLSDKAVGVITGLGIAGYLFAIDYFCNKK